MALGRDDTGTVTKFGENLTTTLETERNLWVLQLRDCSQGW